MVNRLIFPPEPVAQVDEETGKPDEKKPKKKEDPSTENNPVDNSEESDPENKEETLEPLDPDNKPAPLPKTDKLKLTSLQSGHTTVIFSNRGGTVSRLFLTSDKYQAIEEKHGYLGYLESRDAQGGGAEVLVVPPQTPAAKAGLQVGDIITAVDAVEIGTRTELQKQLLKTRPEQEIKLTVKRKNAGEQKKVTIAATLKSFPLSLIQPELLSPEATMRCPASFRLSLLSRQGTTWEELSAKMKNDFWEGKVLSDGAMEYRYQLDTSAEDEKAAKWEIIKRYRFVKSEKSAGAEQYQLTLELEFKNISDKEQVLSYQLSGPNGLPVEGWWYTNKILPSWGGGGVRDVALKTEGQGLNFFSCNTIYKAHAKEEGKPEVVEMIDLGGDSADQMLHFAGVDTQYFAVMLQPADNEFQAQPRQFARAYAHSFSNFKHKDKRAYKLSNVSCELISQEQTVAAGKSVKERYIIYSGPKEPEVLLTCGMQDLNYYGWFGVISKPLLAILHLLEYLCGSYGIAVILLTVLVRLCLLPFGRKAALNAQKMQMLSPEMRKIADKYKNDLEKRGKAQRELFAKHNYNPLGGCMIMFFQLPVFLGLYRGLSVDIDLRGAPLIHGLKWCSNLSAPDQLYYWEPYLWESLGGPMGWLGPYLNLLPLITVVLFIIQQKLFTPPATDDQTRMQQTMMSYMTLFIGVMFFKVPSGLCLYFITSSLWGIAERKLLPKPKLKEGLEATTEPVEKKESAASARAKKKRQKKK